MKKVLLSLLVTFLLKSNLVFSQVVSPYSGDPAKDFASCVDASITKEECVACVKATYGHYKSEYKKGRLDCDCRSGTLDCSSCINDGDPRTSEAGCLDCVAGFDALLNDLAQKFLAAITACNSLPSGYADHETPPSEAFKTGDGLEDIIPQSVSIYPNPASEKVVVNFVSFDETMPTTFVVISSLGSVVKTITSNFEVGIQKQEIGLVGLSSGFYFIKVSGSYINYHEKIIIAN